MKYDQEIPSAAPAEKSLAYQQLWRIVDGAVIDVFKSHKDYLSPKGRRSAKNSIVKRVTGTVLGFAEQSAKGRSNAAANDDPMRDRQSSGLPRPEEAGGAIPRHPQSIPRLHSVKVKHKPGWTRAFRHDLEARITTHARLITECSRKAPL